MYPHLESRKDRYARQQKQRRRNLKRWKSIGLLLIASFGCILALPFTMHSTTDQATWSRKAVPSSSLTKISTLKKESSIRIVFAGDALMDGSVKETIRKKGPDYPFDDVREEVSKADYAVVNLETAVTYHHERDTNQLFTFKSDPKSLLGLKNAGFDLVTLANNHTLDFKQKGFLDTINYLKQYEIPYVGGGRNKEEAYRAHQVILKEKTIKFLAFSRFIPQAYWFAAEDRPGIAEAYHKSSVLPVIKKERKNCDYLLVYLHWGVEKNHRPEKWQRKYAREMIDAGADAIVGSHVHVLQSFEFYKKKPIAYSIGNFLFPDYVRGDTADTGLLTLTLNQDNISLSFNPYFIYKDQIIKRDEAYIKKQAKYLESLSFDVKINGKQIHHSTS